MSVGFHVWALKVVSCHRLVLLRIQWRRAKVDALLDFCP